MIPRRRPDAFLRTQLKALSIAMGCLIVYYILKTDEVKDALGVAYAYYRMVIVTVGLSALALSGFEGIRLLNLINDVKQHIKSKLNQESQEDK